MQVKLVAIDKVAASLRGLGWWQPIVVETEMTVIVGHTWLLAAKRSQCNRTRRALLHLSYSYAPPFGPAILVTQNPKRSFWPNHTATNMQLTRPISRGAVSADQ